VTPRIAKTTCSKKGCPEPTDEECALFLEQENNGNEKRVLVLRLKTERKRERERERETQFFKKETFLKF
jgi:hypothetical protein